MSNKGIKERAIETMLHNNGLWYLGDEDGQSIFEYDEISAVPIWTRKDDVEKSEEYAYADDDQICGMNLYEFVLDWLQYYIEFDEVQWILIYHEGAESIVSCEELQKILLTKLEQRITNQDNYAYFEEETTWNPKETNKKEIESILAANPEKKYRYFISNVANYRKVWVLEDEKGIALSSDEEGNVKILAWPAKEYAAINAVLDYQQCQPCEINLFEFLFGIIPQFENVHECSGNGLMIFAEIKDEIEGITVNTNDFIEDIYSELNRL